MYSDFPGIDRVWANRQILTPPGAVEIQTGAHQIYALPKMDMMAWSLSRIRWRDDAQVLDVGVGAGAYLDALQTHVPAVQTTAGDLSLSLLHQARAPETLPKKRCVFDIQALPFPDDSFDVVLANHLLHQVPDIDRALGEIRRVLRPTGTAVFATHTGYYLLRLGSHLMRFDDLYRRVYALLGVPDVERLSLWAHAQRFHLENGLNILTRHFHAVARYDHPASLVFPSVDPMMAYLDSTRSSHEPELPEGLKWEHLMDVMLNQIDQIIGYFGKMEIDKLSGVFVATNNQDVTASVPFD